ncbi:hypothetical protein KR51_00011420 [Rubidibacter lacunae KORDI 51-2]|uniref:Uncharacterized protein n=1 Tax=Rubidibacter lacunae KORDI 51-2 TaxID=582515 RepID=U5DCF6_9CHRO|nr:hypothetical protein KR51_00011420 [Rubidibacter lacunae KORDI 51-2]
MVVPLLQIDLLNSRASRCRGASTHETLNIVLAILIVPRYAPPESYDRETLRLNRFPFGEYSLSSTLSARTEASCACCFFAIEIELCGIARCFGLVLEIYADDTLHSGNFRNCPC